MARVGRPKIFEDLNPVLINLTSKEKAKLDEICEEYKMSRHEYLGNCLKSDTEINKEDNINQISYEMKQKDLEIEKLKKELEMKEKEMQNLNKTIENLNKSVEKLELKNEKLEEKIKELSKKREEKDVKLSLKLEELKKKCRDRVEACKNNVGELEYKCGIRDQWHSKFMSELAQEYQVLKLGEGLEDDYLERELAKFV